MTRWMIAAALMGAVCSMTAFGGALEDLDQTSLAYKAALDTLNAARAQGEADAVATAEKAVVAARESFSKALIAAAKNAAVSNDALEEAAAAADRQYATSGNRSIGWALSAAIGWRWAALKDATLARKYKEAALAELGSDIKRHWTNGVLYVCWYAKALNDEEALVFLRSCAAQGKTHLICEILPLMPRSQAVSVATAVLKEMDAVTAKTFLTYTQKGAPTVVAYIVKLNAIGEAPDADAVKFLDEAISVMATDPKMEDSTVALIKELRARKESLQKSANPPPAPAGTGT